MSGFLYKKILSFLQSLAKRMLERHMPKIIVVTGSVGKTSTVRACRTVLEDDHTVWDSFDCKHDDVLAIPLTILGIRRNPRGKFDLLMMLLHSVFFYHRFKNFPDVLILEVRTRMPGDISMIMAIIGKIDILIYTHISEIPPHLAFFKNIKEYVNEKKILSKYLKDDGFIVYDFDSAFSRGIGDKVKRKSRSIGFDADADYYAENPHPLSENEDMGIGYKLHYEEQKSIPIRLPHVIAFHHVYATLNAIAVAKHFGIHFVEISKRIQEFQPLKQRMELKKGIKRSTLIDDTYNASPESVKAALSTLNFLGGTRRKVGVIGDMLELGEMSEEGHRIVGEKAADVLDVLITYGNASRFIADAAKKISSDLKVYHFTEKETLIDYMRRDIIQEHDLVLVKGSRKMMMEEIVENLENRPPVDI